MTKIIPRLNKKRAYNFIHLKKKAKIVCFMTYSVEFSNDFTKVFDEASISKRCGEKIKLFYVVYCDAVYCGFLLWFIVT